MSRARAALGVVVCLAAALLVAPSSALAVTGDPSAAQARASQWWLDGLGVSKAQEVTRGEGVTVCVVDAFFDTSHPDFVGADVSVGADLTHATLSDFVGDPQKDHGTAMAALIVGQGSGPDRKEGTLGTAPKSKFVGGLFPWGKALPPWTASRNVPIWVRMSLACRCRGPGSQRQWRMPRRGMLWSWWRRVMMGRRRRSTIWRGCGGC